MWLSTSEKHGNDLKPKMLYFRNKHIIAYYIHLTTNVVFLNRSFLQSFFLIKNDKTSLFEIFFITSQPPYTFQEMRLLYLVK